MPKRVVDSPAKAFLPGRRPQGPKQQSSQYSTSTSTRSRTRTFCPCSHQRFQNHSHLRNWGPSIAYAMHKRLFPKAQPPPKLGGQALRTQCKKRAGSGTIDHPQTTDRAAARAPDTRRKRRSLRNSGTLRHGGGQSPRLHSARGYIITLFLPRFYPTFTPLRVYCRVSTLFLPRFYPVAPISFYPYG